jgi:hypothetical protein
LVTVSVDTDSQQIQEMQDQIIASIDQLTVSTLEMLENPELSDD